MAARSQRVPNSRCDSVSITTLATNWYVNSDADTWYEMLVKLRDNTVEVYRRVQGSGGAYTLLLSTNAAGVAHASQLIRFSAKQNTDYRFDNIGMSANTAYAYNAANELTAATLNGDSVTTFTYDAWGRLTTRSRAGKNANYWYQYGGKLYQASSNFLGESSATYDYGADGKRRQRTYIWTTWYNWDGWKVINEEDGNGNRQMTYIGDLAQVGHPNPENGDWYYYYQDHLGSTRRIRNQSKASKAKYDYLPYGEFYSATFDTDFAAPTHLYTGHTWDPNAQMYFAPFRYYSPTTARWLTRDPLGMVNGPNLYGYVGGDPVNFADPLGLWYGGKPTNSIEAMCGAGQAAIGALGQLWGGLWSWPGHVLGQGGRLFGGPPGVPGGDGTTIYRDNPLIHALPASGVTFGNVINYPPGVDPDKTVRRYDREGRVRLSEHEYAHVRQYRIWGPFFVPGYIGGGICAKVGSWFGCGNGVNPFEQNADDKCTQIPGII